MARGSFETSAAAPWRVPFASPSDAGRVQRDPQQQEPVPGELSIASIALLAMSRAQLPPDRDMASAFNAVGAGWQPDDSASGHTSDGAYDDDEFEGDEKSVPAISSTTTTTSSSSRQFSEKGRQFQKGRFTPDEKEILRKAVLDYVREHDLGDAGIQMLCAKKRRPELRGAWSIIAQCLPHRSVSSCYHFCTRAFADRSTGKWTDDDIALLRQLVAKHGRKWTLIGSMIERLPCSCRDKYRLLEKRGSKWTLDEEELLVQHMRAYGDTVPLELPRHDPSSCLEHWRVKFAGYIVDGEGVACAADQKLLRGVIQQQADTFHAIQWSCIDVPDWPASFRAWRWEVLAGTVKSYCTFITGPVEISKMVLQHIASQSLPLSPPGQHRQVVAAPGQLLHQAPIVALQQHPQAFAQQHPQPQRQNQEHQQQYVNNDLFAGEEGSVGLVDLQGL